MDPRNVSDEVLVERMEKRARRERRQIIDFLIDLIEVERRGLYVKLGYSSLFTYLIKHLRYARGTAFRRCEAMDVVAAFPDVVEWIRNGRTNLGILAQLKVIMTAENHLELLARCEGKTRSQIDGVINSVLGSSTGTDRPLTLPFTEEDWQLLEEVKNLLSHTIPNARPIEVVRASLKAMKKQLETRKHGAAKARKSKKSKDPHYVTKAVAREVRDRDREGCTYVGPTGARCGTKYKLEYHHIDPKGPSTAENVTLHCRTHNFHRAEVDYGAEYMKLFRVYAREAVPTYGSRSPTIGEVASVPLELLPPSRANAAIAHRR